MVRGTANNRPRAPGRPPSEDNGARRETLLDAAVALFAERGQAATTQRAIARRAGVTPALSNYYFGRQEALLAAIVEERIAPVLQDLGKRIGPLDAPPAVLAGNFIRAMDATIAAHPWFPALWLRELASHDGSLRQRMMERIKPLPRALGNAFAAKSETDDQLPPGVDPRLLVVSLIALTLFPAAAEPVWRSIFPAAEDLGREQLLLHTITMVQGALGASPAKGDDP